MNYPTNIKYTSEHEWIRIEDDEEWEKVVDIWNDSQEA